MTCTRKLFLLLNKTVTCSAINPVHVSDTVTVFFMHNFSLAVNDTLDDILGESDDEEEQDAIVSQVLDEIGIEITGKVNGTAVCS